LNVGISIVVVFAVRFLAPVVVYLIFFLVLIAGLGPLSSLIAMISLVEASPPRSSMHGTR
jgi:hypothetical protein